MITKIKNRLEDFRKTAQIRKIENERPVLSNFKNKAMCVFSSPRGGSTWLTEMLHEASDFIVINEPFFQGKYRTDGQMPHFLEGRKYLSEVNYWYHHPITHKNKTAKDLQIFNELLSGKHLNIKIAPYSTIDELQKFNQILVKFCYGNLMLPWIVDQFEATAILLIRHPCAVIASQLKVKGAFQLIEENPTFQLPNFIEQSYFEPYQEILKKIKRPEENLAALWAITVGKMMQHPENNKKWLTIKYEDLTLNTKEEIFKIKRWANGFRWKEEEPDYKKPSRSTLDANLTKHFEDGTQLTKWKNILSSSQIANIQAVLRDFKVENYD